MGEQRIGTFTLQTNLEDHLQMAIAIRLRQMVAAGEQFLWAADQNAAKRSMAQAAKCKAMGLTPGEADLRIYLKNSKIVHIELKTAKGRLSPAQRQRHKELADLGHTVYVVQEASPEAGADTVEAIVRKEMANGY